MGCVTSLAAILRAWPAADEKRSPQHWRYYEAALSSSFSAPSDEDYWTSVDQQHMGVPFQRRLGRPPASITPGKPVGAAAIGGRKLDGRCLGARTRSGSKRVKSTSAR